MSWRTAVAIMGAWILWAGATPALAEGEAAESSKAPQAKGIEEIVVTARRREESLQKVPISASAFTPSDIASYSVDDLIDIEAQTPGVYVIRPSIGGGTTGLSTIRGMVGVAVYQDDVLLTGGGFGADFFDVERVEILKGPQGTLFGRNTTGGAFQIVSKKPGPEWGGYLKTTFGDYHQHDVEGAINIPITEELLSRIAFKFDRQDEGLGKSLYNGDEFDNEHVDQVRLALTWQPRENVSVELIAGGAWYDEKALFRGISSATQGDESLDIVPGVSLADTRPPFIRVPRGTVALWDTNFSNIFYLPTPFPTNYSDDHPFNCFGRPGLADCVYPGVYESYLHNQDNHWENYGSGLDNYSKRGQYFVKGDITVDFEAFSVRSITGWQKADRSDGHELDGYIARVIDAKQHDKGVHQWTQEIHVFGSALDSNLDWLVGGYYLHDKTDSFMSMSHSGFGPWVGTSPNQTLAALKVESTAYFANFGYHLPFSHFQGVTLNGGVRFTKDEETAQQYHRSLNTGACNLTTDNGVRLDPCYRRIHDTWDATTWNLGVEWEVTPDTMVYLTHRKGYRSGGIDEFAGVETIARTPFDPEEVLDYEVGIKTDFDVFGMPVRTNAASFYMDYDDIQRGVQILNPTTGAPIAVTQNAAKAHVWGGELELVALPMPELTVKLGFSASVAKYEDYCVDQDGAEPFVAGTVSSCGAVTPIGNPPVTMLVDEDFSSKEFENTPVYQSNVSVRYALSWLSLPSLMEEMSLQADYNTRSSVFYDEEDSFGQNTYGLMNLRLDVEDIFPNVLRNQVNLSVYCRNVFDRYTIASGSVIPALGAGWLVNNPPRRIGVELSYRWGAE